LQERRGEAYVAWHSISNFYYHMVSPKKGSPGAKAMAWKIQGVPSSVNSLQTVVPTLFMIVLIDTDVLIDVALDRRPFSDPAGRLLDAVSISFAAA
jgi:hypothetical protein